MFGGAVVLAKRPAGLMSWPFPAMVLAVVGGDREEMIWSPNDASTDGLDRWAEGRELLREVGPDNGL